MSASSDREWDDPPMPDQPDPPDDDPDPDPEPASVAVGTAGLLCVATTVYLITTGAYWPAVVALGITATFLFAVSHDAPADADPEDSR